MKKLLLFSFLFFVAAVPGISPRCAYASSAEEKMDLAITDNNPFNPSRGQKTTFRFFAKDVGRTFRVRVYTVGGNLVREFPEQYAAKDVAYQITWDGKNQDGETAARGIYLVNLQESGSFTRGIVRKVAVVK